MKKHNLFPSLVIEYDLRNFIEKDKLFKILKSYDLIRHGLVKKGESSIIKPDLLDNPDLYILKNKFQECVSKYCEELDIKTPFISNSWFNVMYKKGKTSLHMHEVSCLSGAYYPLLEENTCNLFFSNPLGGSIINLSPKKEEEYTIPLKHYIMPIKQDYLYLFPSYLQHGTETNKGEARIVVSFNTSF